MPDLLKVKRTWLLLLLIIFSNWCFAQTQATIIKPVSGKTRNYCGDSQTAKAGEILPKPFIVRAVSNSRPVANLPVIFNVVASPKSTDYKLQNSIVYTDSAGYASTKFTLGSADGTYIVEAKINIISKQNSVIFTASARKSNWVFMLVIGLLGGFGLFLFGMNMMSDGMQNAAGDKMRTILSSLTTNRFVAVGVGTFVTMLIQSSSATSVMLVSFVQSGLMRFSQTIGVLLGASIGTTITTQIIALELTDYALLMVAVGFAVTFIKKSQKVQYIGQTILGFGILFFGMHIMSDSMSPLRSYEPFIDILIKLENPVVGILFGALLTALIQSSSAFIGIMIILASQGFLSLEAGIPLIFGSNIGTAITAILASIGTTREAKKVAIAHTLFKILGVLIFAWWIPAFADFVRSISGDSATLADMEYMAKVVPRQIANAHTVFNIAITIIILPFTRTTAMLIHKLLPRKEEIVKQPVTLKYINNSFHERPALALTLAKREILRMSSIVEDMMCLIMNTFIEKKHDQVNEIRQKEEQADFLLEKIKEYLIKISREDVDEQRINEAFQMIYTVKEFEQIADAISVNLCKHAEKYLLSEVEFSEQGKKEILTYFEKALKQVERSTEVFHYINLEKAEIMKKKHKEYRAMADELEKAHYQRLRQEVAETVLTTKTHIEIINGLKQIDSHATNVARILLRWSENETKKKK